MTSFVVTGIEIWRVIAQYCAEREGRQESLLLDDEMRSPCCSSTIIMELVLGDLTSTYLGTCNCSLLVCI